MNLKQLRVIIASSVLLLSPFIHDVAKGDESETPEPEERLVRKAASELPVRANTKVPTADSDKVEREQQAAQPQAVRPPPASLRQGIAPTIPAPQPESECGEVSIQIPEMEFFPLRHHLFGDTNIGNVEKSVEVRAYLKQTPMRIWLTVQVNIREHNKNSTVLHNPANTEFEGRSGAVIFDARQDYYGCEIESVLNETIDYNLSWYAGPIKGDTENFTEKVLANRVSETLYGVLALRSFQPDAKKDRTELKSRQGLLAGATCILNTDGDDKDEVGCGNIEFHPLRLKLRKTNLAACNSFRLTDQAPFWIKPLQHYRGDSDINGKDRDIWIANDREGNKSSYVRVLDGQRVQLVGNLGIRESYSDYSSFDSSFSPDIASSWDVPPHCRIASVEIVSDYLDQSQLIRAVKDQNYHTYEGIGLFKRLICRTDTGSRDGAKSSEGGIGCRVYPKDIKVNLVRVVPDG